MRNHSGMCALALFFLCSQAFGFFANKEKDEWLSFYRTYCPDMSNVEDLDGYDAYCSGVDLSTMQMPERYIERADSVSFAATRLVHVEFLAGLRQVADYINLVNNEIESLSGLSDLESVGTLDLRNNKLTKLEGLSSLRRFDALLMDDTVRSNLGLVALEEAGELRVRVFNPAYSPELRQGVIYADSFEGSAPDSDVCDAIDDRDVLINPQDVAYSDGTFNRNDVVFAEVCVEETAEEVVIQQADDGIRSIEGFDAYIEYSRLHGGPMIFAGGLED